MKHHLLGTMREKFQDRIFLQVAMNRHKLIALLSSSIMRNVQRAGRAENFEIFKRTREKQLKFEFVSVVL